MSSPAPRSSPQLAAVAAIAAAAGLLALAAGLAPAPAQASEQQAYAAALTYATPALVAAHGDTLRFNNLDSVAQHDLVSDQPGQFSTPLIAGGQSAVASGVASLAPGTYSFHCSLHSWMHGELTVVGGGGPSLPQLPGPGGPGPQVGATPNPADLMPHAAPQPLGAAEWPSYGGNLANARDGGPSAPSYNEIPTLRPVWSFRSGDGDFTGTPVIAAGVAVVASGAGTVSALDAATGKLLWQHRLAAPVDGSAAIAGGRVFVPLASPGNPQLAALRLSDGALLWRTVLDSQKDADVYGSPVVWSLPAVATGHAPSTAPRARRPKRPKRRSHHRRRASPRPRRAHQSRTRHSRSRRHKQSRPRHRKPPARPPAPTPTLGADTVFIGTSALYGELNDPGVHVRGSVVAIDAATGAIRWKTYTVAPGHDGGAVWATPAVDPASGRIFVGTGNAYHSPADTMTDSLLALDARTGAIVAHRQATGGDVWNATGGGGGPDYDFGASPNLFAGPHGQPLVGAGQKSGSYWAFDRSTLQPVWTSVVGPGTPVVGGIVGSTAFDGHRIYGPDTTAGEIWALGTDGRLAWVSSNAGPLQFSAVSAGNGVVYSTDMSGTLTAHEAATGATLAKLPIGAPSWGGVALAGGSVFAVTGTQGSGGWVVAYRPST